MLTSFAIAPNIGPTIAPKTAAPNAMPISSPRRSRGEATVSQASAPAQVTVLEKPWTKRASAERRRPVGDGEAEARQTEEDETGEHGELRPVAGGGEPAGDAAEHAPAPKAPTSSPAPVFDSSNSSA